MKKRIFVDTGAFVALANNDEFYNDQAIAFFKKFSVENCTLVTTDYVLDELLTFMRCKKKEPIVEVISFINGINLSEVEVVGITRDIFVSALNLMKKYKDHYFSFTDCVSFEVMKEMKIKDSITTDKYFEIAGFNNLLKI